MWIRIFLRIRLSLKLVCLCRTTGQFFPFGRCPFFIWKFLKITYIIYKRSSIFYGCEIFKYLQEIPHNIHSVKMCKYQFAKHLILIFELVWKGHYENGSIGVTVPYQLRDLSVPSLNCFHSYCHISLTVIDSSTLIFCT